MCYNGKCLHCIEVETGSLIWAIINVVQTGLSSLLCIGLFVYFNMTVKDDLEPPVVLAVGVCNLLLMVGLTISAIEFMFTMFLLVGVMKKHVGYVKAYYIYGVVKLIICFLAVIGISIQSGADPALFLIALFFVFHGLILLMVRNTYLKFNGGEIIQQFSHKPLV